MGRTIWIDPGHGGGKPGAVANGIVEKDLVLDVSKRIFDRWPISSPHILRTTREGDEDISHRYRGAKTTLGDLVVSIHANAAAPEAGGLLAFFWPGNDIGRAVADRIAQAAPPYLYREPGTGKPATEEQYPRVRFILEYHRPTAVLVELGFLTNERDAEFLRESGVRDELAYSILTGISHYLTL